MPFEFKKMPSKVTDVEPNFHPNELIHIDVDHKGYGRITCIAIVDHVLPFGVLATTLNASIGKVVVYVRFENIYEVAYWAHHSVGGEC